ncbi:preprotein translocase subunit SecA [Candidatus Gottesmanbacteria bacterium RBG_16_52_11]|uniref:Protein translocase subunit SecA n=1 Tax=Candidatus Gottesmanbacteria bacterium RBG_16_52_11 TaxID=1798374 RepID=A0A1F5YN72_9BACT|nr:MAG: preprotein translocase subunit SecA [Candidatus Gottesmanbacteria bacterium RBG_16_52_11]
MLKVLNKLFDTNAKEISELGRIVTTIGEAEAEVRKLKDSGITRRTAELRERIASGQVPDDILPEAFALVREAARRTIGERHYDVQLMAGITLHRGKVAEQKTGEGKTLSAIPALYLNALSGRGAHLVTVNDYLARRDAGWMGPVYHLLGMSVSAIISEKSFIYDPEYTDESAQDWRLRHLKPISRRDAYRADITYGINSEFGFDYLRDNMVSDMSQVVQRDYHFAVVDEVDSVLIDEARTPHIISAPDTEATHKYYDYARMVDKLTSNIDYEIDEKLRTAHLTEHGLLKIEKIMGVGNVYENDFETVHHLEAALKARTLFRKDKEYIVKDNQVVIVDEFTGRLLHGRRFSEGIHQAIEAKENVPIQQESKTLATVSLQNYFRMYQKLAGMTGTAATEAEEFKKIYNLDVVVIPTNKPVRRTDEADSVYKTPRAKYAAIVADIIERYKKGQPVLVGTTSIDKNEIISEFLKRKGVPHEVLNAKNHLREALIITQAGKRGQVTVATNMAGRGVDIILGGSKKERWEVDNDKEYQELLKSWQKAHDEVVALGGLHVIGTERHESRRIDNQLRGRSGRQGDPGSSRFFVSLEDEIMRLFGGEQVAKLMTVFKLPEDVPLEHAMVSRSIEQAQVKVEGFHFDSRKHLVEYDDVLNKHREIIYGRRRKVLEGENQRDTIAEYIDRSVRNTVAMYAGGKDSETDTGKIMAEFVSIIPFDPDSQKHLGGQLSQYRSGDEMADFLTGIARQMYENREKQLSPDVMRQVERWVSLGVIDNLWMEHLDAIDDLREGIGLRGYGQRDPLVEYKNEAFGMFERLVSSIENEIVHRIYRVQVSMTPPQAARSAPVNQAARPEVNAVPAETKITREAKRVRQNQSAVSAAPAGKKQLGRNDPCPCGSGKKWKKCHYPLIP